MATWRQALEVVMTDEEIARLLSVSRSRTEPASRVQRAQMLLAYRENPSFFAVGRRVGVHHQTVQRCIERALAYGPLMALDDRARPGKEPTITPEAKAWLVSPWWFFPPSLLHYRRCSHWLPPSAHVRCRGEASCRPACRQWMKLLVLIFCV